MKKGDILEGMIEHVDFPNKGRVMTPEGTVTVKNGIPGQRIRFQINKKRKNQAEGRLLEVLEPSPLETRAPQCSSFPACGGCMYQTMAYEDQLRMKEQQVKTILDAAITQAGQVDASGAPDYVFEGIKGSPHEFAYRNKMEFSFGDEYKDGPLSLGLHKKGSTYDVLTVSDCQIVHPDMTAILTCVLEYFRAYPPVSSETGGSDNVMSSGIVGQIAETNRKDTLNSKNDGVENTVLSRASEQDVEFSRKDVSGSKADSVSGTTVSGVGAQCDNSAQKDMSGSRADSVVGTVESGVDAQCDNSDQKDMSGSKADGVAGTVESGVGAQYDNSDQKDMSGSKADGVVGTGESGVGTQCDNSDQKDIRNSRTAEMEECADRIPLYYHKMSHKGYLRHLLLRRAETTGEILVNLVTTSQKDYDLTSLVTRLMSLSLDGTIVGILHHINDSVADIVRADETRILCGKDYFYETVLGLRFKITPFSFFQTNTLGAEILYSTARDYIADTRDKTVFDLYSGTGTIAQLLAAVAKEVTGVEIVGEAVEAARENARQNGLTNCHFIAGDVLKVLDDLPNPPDMIVLDPPRDGIHPKALPKIIHYGADRIVYISCKPTSLARDLQVLIPGGYRVEKACCVDLFCSTVHVETVVGLQRKDI